MGNTTLEDPTAMFLELCREYRPYIHNFVKRRVRNEADVDEIVQEVFMRAYDSREELMAISNRRGWLTGTAKNVIREFAKASTRQDSIVEMIISTKSDNDSYSMDLEEYADLFNELTSDDRTVLRLYAIEGYSFQEIAKKLSKREGTVKKRYNRAQKKLEKFLLNRNLIK